MVVKFKVGDRVRLLRYVGGNVKVGDIGLVCKVIPSSVYVNFISQYHYNVYREDIELVDPEGDVLWL